MGRPVRAAHPSRWRAAKPASQKNAAPDTRPIGLVGAAPASALERFRPPQLSWLTAGVEVAVLPEVSTNSRIRILADDFSFVHDDASSPVAVVLSRRRC